MDSFGDGVFCDDMCLTAFPRSYPFDRARLAENLGKNLGENFDANLGENLDANLVKFSFVSNSFRTRSIRRQFDLGNYLPYNKVIQPSAISSLRDLRS